MERLGSILLIPALHKPRNTAGLRSLVAHPSFCFITQIGAANTAIYALILYYLKSVSQGREAY